jgi:membrane protein DedA with SNARE-associated domain
VRRSKGFLARHAAPGLVAAKFVPGLGAVITPLAALRGMSYGRFLLFDGAGSLLYGTSYILLGFFFTPQLKELLKLLGRLGLGAFTFLLVVITVYLLFKIIKRRSRRRQKADLSQPEMSPPPHVGGYELGHL